MDDEERELEAILGALGGTRFVYLIAASYDSGMYWARQLKLRVTGPPRQVNCMLLTPDILYSSRGLRGRRFERGDVVYHTGERIGNAWMIIQQELRHIGWKGNISKILDDR